MEKLKTKCASLENTNTSLKETCLMLDKQVENFETYNQELEEKLKSHLEEKLELQVTYWRKNNRSYIYVYSFQLFFSERDRTSK